jgi:GTP-binding protein Era
MKKVGMVVLLGRPNVGKSTFLNSVLKEEISIVSPKAQTTRDQVRGILNEERGQLVFVDTPGVHQAREGGINAYMIQEVKRALEGSDVVLYIIDPYSKPEAEAILIPYLKESKCRLVIVVNKADRLQATPEKFKWLDGWIDQVKTDLAGSACQWIQTVSISALEERGIRPLLDLLYEVVPEGPPLFDPGLTGDGALTDRSTRFVVSEMIRKQLFMNLGDELPYSCAVEIEAFHENQKPIRIHAMIYVERDSQKGMVIGAGGKKIKDIGTGARIEIEKLLGEKVFLELRVKVLEGWTSEQNKMKRLGYSLDAKRKVKNGK